MALTQALIDAIQRDGDINDRIQNQQIRAALQSILDDGYTYTEVAVNSAEIKAIGSTPKTILAAAGAGKYYDWIAIIEYTHNGTAYTTTGMAGLTITDSTNYIGAIATLNMLSTAASSVFQSSSKGVSELDVANVIVIGQVAVLNDSVILTDWNGVDPTLGNGTILVKVWSKIKTVGSDL